MRNKVIDAMASLLLLIIVACVTISAAQSQEQHAIDPAALPIVMKEPYDTLTMKCVKCHGMDRILKAIDTGVSPISGAPFDKERITEHLISLVRKNDANITKDDAKEVLKIVGYLIDTRSPR